MKEEPSARRTLPRINTRAEQGLSAQQAQERLEEGYGNTPVESTTRSVKQIIKSNVLTYFNLVFFVLAAFVIAVGSWHDLMFMPVILVNTAIGIVQELRSKKTLDKLSLLNQPQSQVIRDGRPVTVPSAELVLDDVAVFSSGSQICADAVVLSGSVQVNEALITGEPDEIEKKQGDVLLSGSFVVSGSCRARLERVGADSFASRLTIEAKRQKRARQSEMMKSLTRLVQVIGIIIIPVGIFLFYNQRFVLGLGIRRSVVSTVAALIGMIPEGLYLLTSVALAVSVIRLAQKKTLVHDLGCIETLARVNVLCVDKTGTITLPEMQVEELVLLCPDRFEQRDVEMLLADHAANLGAENDTMRALLDHFQSPNPRRAERTVPFTSATKFSASVYEEGETYLLGAPEMILGSEYARYREQIEPHSARGLRVLLLAMYDGPVGRGALEGGRALPIALVLLSNRIRENAPKTFAFFAEQGVAIKVISGDNPVTVSNIAQKAGVADAERYVDARELTSDSLLQSAASQYTVFGRVTPEQKRKLIRALKAQGNTVAMTGDGVNDVLALKEADCSVAMASGSDVACQVSHLVLLDSDFASMPSVVMEGRRVINNIERSAALFLVKNIFSFIMVLITLSFTLAYPLTSAQLSLVSMLTIGVPSFILALEPNRGLVTGHFLRNVLLRALPAGLTDVLLVLMALLFGRGFAISDEMLSTVCAVLLAIGGLVMLLRVCRPFNAIRKAMCILLTFAMIFAIFAMPDFFGLHPLDLGSVMVLATLGLLSYPMMQALYMIFDRISAAVSRAHKRRKQERLI